VHWHGPPAVSTNALFAAQSLLECLAKADADILNRVVGIHLQIAFGVNREVKKTVTGDLGQHMVKKRHTGFDAVLTSAVYLENQLDCRLFRGSVD
jgi:hypothetical protein